MDHESLDRRQPRPHPGLPAIRQGLRRSKRHNPLLDFFGPGQQIRVRPAIAEPPDQRAAARTGQGA
ncbi:MAG: hypothetical protein JO287_06745 [Pseudonocardiales bacterium]|nr:hypothetical protein [Pseudonocardiales bacterium]